MQQYGGTEMAESWRTVRKNTVQVAQDIPAEHYGYQAAADTMTVAQLLAHLATSTLWAEQLHFVERRSSVSSEDFGRYLSDAGTVAAGLTSKETIIKALVVHGESLAVHLERLTEAQLHESVTLPNASKSRFEMLLGIKEHEMHHRAQLMLIERLLGIVPHLTRARQPRR